MKIFIKNIIVLSVIVITSYILCVILFSTKIINNKIPNSKNITGIGLSNSLLRFREIEKIDKVDILFLGPSHTYRGFDTRVFADSNISSFNMGSSSQSPLNSYYLLRKYLSIIHPKTIIFEVSSETLELDGNESSVDLISNLPFSWEMVKMALNTKNNMISINTMFGIYLRRLIYPLKNETQCKIKNNKYISGGYVETTHKNTYAQILNNPIIKPHKLIIEQMQLEYFNKLIDFIKSKGIKLIIVSTPIVPQYKNSIKNYDEIKEVISKIANNKDVRYIDFNDSEIFNAIGLKTDTHFIDYTHLDKEGAKIFNRYLIGILKKLEVTNQKL